MSSDAGSGVSCGKCYKVTVPWRTVLPLTIRGRNALLARESGTAGLLLSTSTLQMCTQSLRRAEHKSSEPGLQARVMCYVSCTDASSAPSVGLRAADLINRLAQGRRASGDRVLSTKGEKSDKEAT